MKRVNHLIMLVVSTILLVTFGNIRTATAREGRPTLDVDSYQFVKGPNPNRTYVRIGIRANLQTPEFVKQLGTDAFSLRAENPTKTLALCKIGGRYRRPQGKTTVEEAVRARANNALWDNCPENDKYVFVVPGETLVVPVEKHLTPLEEREVLAQLVLCTTLDCLKGKAERLGAKIQDVPAPTAAPQPDQSARITQLKQELARSDESSKTASARADRAESDRVRLIGLASLLFVALLTVLGFAANSARLLQRSKKKLRENEAGYADAKAKAEKEVERLTTQLHELKMEQLQGETFQKERDSEIFSLKEENARLRNELARAEQAIETLKTTPEEEERVQLQYQIEKAQAEADALQRQLEQQRKSSSPDLNEPSYEVFQVFLKDTAAIFGIKVPKDLEGRTENKEIVLLQMAQLVDDLRAHIAKLQGFPATCEFLAQLVSGEKFGLKNNLQVGIESLQAIGNDLHTLRDRLLQSAGTDGDRDPPLIELVKRIEAKLSEQQAKIKNLGGLVDTLKDTDTPVSQTTAREGNGISRSETPPLFEAIAQTKSA